MSDSAKFLRHNFGKLLRVVVKDASSLAEVSGKLLECFKGHVLLYPDSRFGYVAGIITSDGAEHMGRNLERLALFTEEIRRCREDVFVFSATDIFLGSDLSRRLQISGAQEEDFMLFWRSLLESGFVKKLFLTPGWERSRGAIEEFEIAKRQGLEIYLLEAKKELANLA